MAEGYEELLDKAISQVPKVVMEKDRFQIPEAEIVTAGNRTTVKNIKAIASALNRDVSHLSKYLLRELGAAGEAGESQLTVQGKFSKAAVDERIRRYAEEFVICRECGKPDTRIEQRGRFQVLRCGACGARNPVRSV
ncbi:MAG: translation initiation factor IF-2 subunit beta [Candidatus Hadarchaeota archaeon]